MKKAAFSPSIFKFVLEYSFMGVHVYHDGFI